MQELKAWFEERNVTVVVVSFANPETLSFYQSIKHWEFDLFSDPDRTFYQAVRLQRLPVWKLLLPSVWKKYYHLLRSGKKLEDYGKDDYFQAGGDFILDRQGNILYAFRSHNPSDRPSVEELKNAVLRIESSLED